MASVLEVDHLVKRFGGLTAVDDVSFHVGDNEILGLIGPNGAGKTVMINLISGFLAPTSGAIRLSGSDIAGMPLHRIARLGVARTFQNIRVPRRLSVLENVMAADPRRARAPLRSLLGVGSRRGDIDRAMGFLEFMGLSSLADQLAATLPYGAARRLEIARALSTEPSLLLLDEPAAGMNEAETAELVEDVRRARSMVRAIILIEHDMSLISALADRAIGLNFGRVMAEGAVANVLSDPEVRRAYLGDEDDA
jgi:branched-chain amino acid transport system ATP-binding protein